MIVDSSVWIEILSNGKLSAKCESRIKNKNLMIPSIVIYEVYKKFKVSTSEETALEVMGYLSKNKIIEIDRDISITAADLAIEHDLAMADALVLACAHAHKTTLLTLDNDFASLPETEVIR